MTFAEQIKTIREDLHYTQDELARMLGVAKQSLSNWECGRNAPWPKHQRIYLSILAKLTSGVINKPRRSRVCDRIIEDLTP